MGKHGALLEWEKIRIKNMNPVDLFRQHIGGYRLQIEHRTNKLLVKLLNSVNSGCDHNYSIATLIPKFKLEREFCAEDISVVPLKILVALP